MKKVVVLLALSVAVWSCKSYKDNAKVNEKPEVMVQVNPVDFAATITQDELKEMLYVYASDEFEGRNTGDAGHDKAVDYLKSFYKNAGIASGTEDGTYEQKVPLNKIFTPELDAEINGKSLEAFTDIVSLAPSLDGTINAEEIVYVGYGVDDDNYSDYNNLDVKGKVVLAKAGEPKNEDGTYKVSGTDEASRWSNGRRGRSFKKDAAEKHGALAFLIVDNAAFNFYANAYKQRYESNASLGMSISSNEMPMHYYMLSDNTAKAIHETIMEDDSAKILKSKLQISQKQKSEKFDSKNVIAYIKGSEKPEEYVVISAHLDHVGVNSKGEIYNGADDDGSGTVAILEIAEAFKAAADKGQGPKRSVVFLHVTAEEKGLLGSRYYTDVDPVFPLENTVANLNIDMIGRTDPKRTEGSRNYIYLIGSDKLSTELHNLSEEVNKKYTNIELDYKYNDDNDPNRFYYRSDHYNFAKNNIPIIFYFNGTHADYHQPGDTPDKIEYDLLENRTRLVFYTAWEVANRSDRIVADKASEPIGN